MIQRAQAVRFHRLTDDGGVTNHRQNRLPEVLILSIGTLMPCSSAFHHRLPFKQGRRWRVVDATISLEGAALPDLATPNPPSRDFEATSRFYARLGFTERWRDGGWMILERGDLVVEFFSYSDLDPARSSFGCCFRMADVGAFFQIVLAAGVPETTQGWPRAHRPRREAWGGLVGAVIDPDGSLIRLVQAPDAVNQS